MNSMRLWAAPAAVFLFLLLAAPASAQLGGTGSASFDGQTLTPQIVGNVVWWDPTLLGWSVAHTYSFVMEGGDFFREWANEWGRNREYTGTEFRVTRDDGVLELFGTMPFWVLRCPAGQTGWSACCAEVVFSGGASELPSSPYVLYEFDIELAAEAGSGFLASIFLTNPVISVDQESWGESKARWRSPN